MKHRAILFDLDGTLLDTLRDLTEATNHVLTGMGKPLIADADCRRMVGNGARTLLRRAAGGDGPALDAALKEFLAYYHEHKYDHTRAFDGIPHVLDTLAGQGARFAVLSNKPHPATVQMVDHLLNAWPFEQVFGQREGVPLKPDPTAALLIAEAMDVPTDAFAFVGDSAEDMTTARAAGMFAVGVTWGMRDEPELHEHGAHAVIHKPAQLLEVL